MTPDSQKPTQESQQANPIQVSKVYSDVPIEHWEHLLVGKRYVAEDTPDEPMV